MDTSDKELTLKQRKWLKLYLELGNATEAAMQVYDCKDRDSAKVIGSENLSKLNFSDAMEQYGLTDHKLIKKTDEGLEANRVISAINTDKQASGATSDFIEVPDYMVRHKYLETALKLKKKLNEKVELTGKDGQSLPITIVAGSGFIPPGVKVTPVSEGSAVGESTEVQDIGMAQKGKENDNGNNGIG